MIKTADLPENAIKHMRVAALLALASIVILLFAGCAGGFGLAKTADVRASTITWERATPTDCGGPGDFAGCASWAGTNCTITMPEDAPDWVVAHEFRHCFGYSHTR